MKIKICIASALALFFISEHKASADIPSGVLKKLRSPSTEIQPSVLFTDSPEKNEGTGISIWVASSGTRLTAKGRDPWASKEGAFGPPPGAETGAAIASSIESNLLTGDSGAFVVCVLIPQVIDNPAMIISRGGWEARTAFDLRADHTQSLILYTGGKETTRQTLRLGSYTPGKWMFVALSWNKRGNDFELETCLGLLESGKNPELDSHKIPNVGELGAPVLIAGRTNKNLSSALLEGGLFCGLAIYEKSLPKESMKELYQEMVSSLKP